MKLGKRALLIAALLLLVCSGYSLAQESVALLGYDAQHTGNGVRIDFHTTAPVDFIVDRFTMGDWVDVWNEDFVANHNVGEIQLEYERPELISLVTGISLQGERLRTSLRIYLGPNADRERIWLSHDGKTTSLFIPELNTQPLPDTLPDQAISSTSAESGNGIHDAGAHAIDFPVESESKPAVTDDVPVEEAAGQIVETFDVAVALDPVWPVEIVAGICNDGLYVPRSMTEESVELVAAVEDVTPPAETSGDETTEQIDPVEIAEFVGDEESALLPLFDQSAGPPPFRINNPPGGAAEYMPNPSFADRGSMAAGGEINAQFLPPQAPPTDRGNGGEEIPDEVGAALGELLNEMLGGEGQTDVNTALPTGISTAGSNYNMSQASAQISTTNGGVGTGKAALSKVRIELFNVLGTPLDQALTLLISPTDYNVIVDASVGSNSVSLSFKDSQTDLKSALDLITRTYGLDYVVESGTIVIASAEKVNGQLVQYDYRVFTLSYANPTSVKQVLLTTGLVGEEEIEVYAGETEYQAVNGSTQLSESTGGTAVAVKEIESDLSSTPPNSILIKAVPERMAQIEDIIGRLDRRPRIIDLEVRVCEANQDAMENFGIEWNNDPVGQSFTGQVWSEQANENGIIEAFTQGSFNRNGFNFTALINHEIETGNVEILAQPTLNTVENRQAIYFAGEKVPYVREVSVDDSGQTKFTVDYINLGVTLNFKPRMDADGHITVDVNPIVSSLLEFIEFPSGLQAPRTQERQLATTVRVEDCEPFILAGLINDTERETMQKVPLLGDLPLLGKLFRNKKTEGNRNEIIIVVVPHIRE